MLLGINIFLTTSEEDGTKINQPVMASNFTWDHHSFTRVNRRSFRT
jgi:hypothetical protein